MAPKSEERLPADWTAKFTVEKGRKTKCYINVRTGQKFFSKEDLLRYVKMNRTQLDEPHPTNGRGRRLSEDRSMKPVAEDDNHEISRGKRHSENSTSKPVAEENNQPEWLPDGWVVDLKTRNSGSTKGRHYKVYTEPLTGCKFFSMPEVLRHLESVKNINSENERKTRHTETSKYEDARKVSTKTEGEATQRKTETSEYEGAQNVSTKKRETTLSVVVEKSTVDDLPPGWIKETKIKKTARGIRKDAFYKDPISGYVFISKKDVFRYLENGQISKYAFKPREGDTDDPEMVTEEVLPPPDVKRQKSEHIATKRQLFSVKESNDECSPAVSKAEVLKKRRGKVSTETGLAAGAPTAEIFPEQTAEMVIDKGAETNEISSLGSSALPKNRGSKKNQGKVVFADNGSVSTPVIDSFHGQRLLENQIECSNGKTRNDGTESAKKRKLNFPPRSSKRLAGIEPELVSNCVTIEQAPKNVTTSKAIANPVSSDVTIPSRGEPSNKFKSSGTHAIPGEQLQKFKSAETTDDKSEQPISLFFGDSLLDPCLESAFKVLVGGLPVNSNPDNGPVLNRETKSSPTTGGKKSSSRKNLINSMQSKNKQELNMSRRSSKRLAGFEPEMVASCESLERAPKNVILESCESKGILAAGLTSSDLVDEVSPQLRAGPVLGLPNRASEVLGLAKYFSSEVNVPASGELSKKTKSSGNVAITGVQSGEANGDESEPPVSLLSGNSYLHPCKAMMGETVVDSVPDNEPVSTTAADILPNRKLLETKVEKSSNKKKGINSMKSKKKQEFNLPCRSSKRLARLEPELLSYSVTGEQACGNAPIESCETEVPTCEKTDPHGLADGAAQQVADGAAQQVEAVHEIMIAQHDCTDIFTLLFEESPEKCGKPFEAQIVSVESSQKLENEKPEEQPQNLETVKLEEQPQNLENEKPVEQFQNLENEKPVEQFQNLENEKPEEQPQNLENEKPEEQPQNLENEKLEEQPQNLENEKPEEQPQNLENEKPEEQPQNLENEKPEEQPQNLENEKPEEQPQNLENEKLEEQPQNLENDRMDNENLESHILFPFGDSWSDPCLEFAFKTLTGAIPVDENLAIQNYLQHHQLDPSNSQKDDRSSMPDFGPINSFHTDVSHPFDAPEKQLTPAPQQQLPANPLQSQGNVSIPSYSIDLNTLTGVIPVDENLAIQNYLQHQLDSSAMPDFGPFNSCQPDVSHPFDAPGKQLAPAPQQQLSANSLPPPGNVSMPSCSGIDLNNLA